MYESSCLRPSKTRTVPVRLIDVPVKQRMAGASRAIREYAVDTEEALLILAIAVAPDPALTAWLRP